jgi:glycosyltransferase involved in cell wall biosynthesis
MGNAVATDLEILRNQPLVSVCLPVFNGERYLPEAIASILAQHHRNIELIISDDASTDHSWNILLTIRDSRLILRRNGRNIGPEHNWNQVLKAAKGKYVKLFHQDDILDPDCISRQVEALENFPDSVFAFCSRRIIDSDGRRLFTRASPWNDRSVSADEVFRACLKAGTNIIGEPSSVLFRNAIASRTGGFDGNLPFVIDLDYWFRLMEHGSAYCMKTSLMSFRITSGQWSAAIGWDRSAQFISFMEKLIKSGCFHAGRWQAARGRMMARLNNLSRAFLYYVLAR